MISVSHRVEDILGKGENNVYQLLNCFSQCFQRPYLQGSLINPLPHMPILGSSNSAANKGTKSKIWTNWDTVI